MTLFRRLAAGIRALIHRSRAEEELDSELREFLEAAVEQKIQSGMSREQAIRAARVEMGSIEAVKDRVRDVGWESHLEACWQDLRYAGRLLRRSPGFTAIAVGSSSLGIGLCSVIFAILNVAVLKPLPVDEPGRLMSLSEMNRRTGQAGSELSYPDFLDLRQAQSFEGMAASNPLLPAAIGAEADPQRHWGALATANYFAVVKPGFALGRGFDPGRDDMPGEPPVVVLSYALWNARFSGDAGVVGRSISINNRPATVIGVTSPAFRGTEAGIVPEFWIPFSMLDEVEGRLGPVSRNRTRYWLMAVARLRPGVDAGRARQELDVIARTLNAAFARDENRGFHLERAGRVDPELRSGALPLVAVSLGATALVLLTACANVANLLLGRAAARRREIAARMALGASRGRLLRQLLTESLLLALAGGLGGWLIATWVSPLFGLLRIPFGVPFDLSIAIDYRVLLFCLALSVVTAILFGLAPALRATKLDPVTDLKADAGRTVAGDRFGFRNGLVVAQVAICTVLLLGMGLFLRSLEAARRMDTGVRTSNLLLLAFDPGLDRRPDSESKQVLRHILERARAVPGVASATLTSSVPLTFLMNNSRFVPAEKAKDRNAPRTRTDIYFVGSDFFATMGIPVLAGEDFRAGQPATRKLAIVNDAFARAAFPGESPIGRRIVGDGKALEIAGLVATAKSRTIGEPPRPSIYLPMLTEYAAREIPRGVTLVVNTRDEPASYAGALREAIRSADRSLAVFDVRTMERHVADALLVPRLARTVSVVAGGIGIALAMMGVYGVLSFAVIRRRRELGIRLAIGARPREILVMVLQQGGALVIAGVALGVLAALAATRLASSLLYGVSPADPMTFIVMPSIVVAVAFIACMLPARAAARLDPVDVLRAE